tara:strand:+ start:218 stop:391 length:174 start_codon:yes stop_codon:yes gene_type:complete
MNYELVTVLFVLGLLFLQNRSNAVRRRQQQEEMIKKFVKDSIQKRKLDELYGRDQDR